MAITKVCAGITVIGTIPGAVSKAEIIDPDENHITFGQPLSADG